MIEEIEMKTRQQEVQEEDDDEDEDEEDEEVEEYTSCMTADHKGETEEKAPLWNYARVLPKSEESISTIDNKFITTCITILKLAAYLLTFCGVLFGGVFSKLGMLLMTSQLAPNKIVTVSEDNRFLQLMIPQEERYLWMWALFMAYSGPEFATFFRSLRQILFKSHTMHDIDMDGQSLAYILAFIMETLHTIGMSILVFEVLPQIDSIRGAMLTNCVCLIPAILGAFSYDKYDWRVGVDVLAILFQLSGFVLWPIIEMNSGRRLWFIPISLFLISCGWWMNFVSENSKFRFIKVLGKAKDKLKENITLYRLYIWLSLYKIIIFGITTCGILSLQGVDLKDFFLKSNYIFSTNRTMEARKLEEIPGREFIYIPVETEYPVVTIGVNVLFIVAFQMFCSYISYAFSKFSYKIMISSFGFAFPVILVVPVTISFIMISSIFRNNDPGVFNDVLASYIFFDLPTAYTAEEIFIDKFAIIWCLWVVSQTWIARHVWTPKVERLSRTEKLFATPMFSDFLVDQCVLMNRRRDKEDKKSEMKSTYLPHIIACATMWHETRPEMLEMLKSIMRMDQDQYFRKSGAENLNPDEETNCYTFETHIFFDDAFEVEDEETGSMIMNGFVRDLIQSMNKAKDAVYKLDDVLIKPPEKTGTPYGGRLTYTLPYGTKLYVHLKNKDKIRHRKRWSQVMYMYYLLGYNIMEKEQLSIEEKMKKADNVFLLALDGDIDFKPEAVILLVDLMKKNPDLGAACGRIHPVGSGFMVWYQEFEYAIGHWLQKATEHMIGCVLCSPGCFSLFRAGALMANNVMKTYTTKAEEARHYVQYDQGEDRWLCTLLLQRGYRVEYSAASDAYTHCPESFNEFYTQRRRWVPSTMANILDLLCDYKNIVKINNHISLLYISYQFMLMIGTVLGPGTIFLLLVSAFNAVFRIDNWTCFLYNMIPIVLYVVICLSMNGKAQLFSALILSGIYGLIMMAVLVGMLMQISEDGYLAPPTIFLYIVAGEIIIAGLIHPQEILCLLRGPIYYVTIPSMYLLLIIYSVCNLNIVTWGTREVKQKRTKAELEEEKKAAEEEEKKKKKGRSFHSILGNLGKNQNKDEEGAIEFSLGNLFKFMLCTKPKSDAETKELAKMNDSLEMVGKRLERLERGIEWSPLPTSGRVHRSSRRTSMENIDTETTEGIEKENEDEKAKPEEEEDKRDDLINPYWIEDEILNKSNLVVMDMNETTFWKDLIKKYLHPLLEDKEKKEKISKALRELRDKVVTTFFMLNALFVIIVFLLQMNKSKVHIKWPLDARVNMTIDRNKEIMITKTHLQLEPVGVLFIVFFAIILVIQFLAMLLHRFETLCHLLSSATLFPRKKTFELKLKEGKKQLWEKQQETLSSFHGGKHPTLNVQEETDKIFSQMKHQEDMDKAEKEEKRRSSLLRKLTQNTFEMNPITRSRYSQFRNVTKLEQVVEEGAEA